MKRMLVCAMVLVLALAAGCSGVQMKSDAAAQVADYATAVAPLAKGVTVPADAKAFLSPQGLTIEGKPYTATALTLWYSESSANWLVYAFTPSVKVYCDAKYILVLQRVAAGAAAACNMGGTATDAHAELWAQTFAKDIEDLNAMRLGVQP